MPRGDGRGQQESPEPARRRGATGNSPARSSGCCRTAWSATACLSGPSFLNSSAGNWLGLSSPSPPLLRPARTEKNSSSLTAGKLATFRSPQASNGGVTIIGSAPLREALIQIAGPAAQPDERPPAARRLQRGEPKWQVTESSK